MSFPSNEFCLPNVEPPNVFRPAADDRLPNDAFFIFNFFSKTFNRQKLQLKLLQFTIS